MGYIRYSKALEEKIKSLGIIRLKRDIRLKDGVIKAGSRLKCVHVDKCNEKGDECVLTVFGYREEFAQSVDIKNFNIDDWFESDSSLAELDAQFCKVQKKIDDIESCIDCASFFVAIGFALLGAIIGDKIADSSVGVIVGMCIGLVATLIARLVCEMAIPYRYEQERDELDKKINKILE